MNRTDRPLASRSIINLILLSLMVVVVGGIFYINYTQDKRSNAYGVLIELQKVKGHYQRIDMLFEKKISHQSFDQIVNSTREIEKTLEQLDRHIQSQEYIVNERLAVLLNELYQDFEDSKRYIERYKSWNGLVINSTRLVYDMHGYIKSLIVESDVVEDKHELIRKLDKITWLVALISFDSLSDETLLMEQLQELSHTVKNDPKLYRTVINEQKHVDMILRGFQLMDQIHEQNSLLKIDEHIEEIYQILLKDFQEKDEKNHTNTHILSVVVIILFLILFYFHRKESSLYGEVVVLNDQLHAKLAELEGVNKELNNLITLFDNHVIASETDTSGRITYASQAFCDVSGYTKDELIGKPHNIVRHPDVGPELFEELWKTLKSGKKWVGELKNRSKTGEGYWLNALITPEYDEHGDIKGYSSIRHDITAKKELEVLSQSLEEQVAERTKELEVMVKKVQQLSITDELTGLHNRRYYVQLFDKEFKRAKRQKRLFCYLLVDIDNFKAYNDHYGHQSGDDALKRVAQIFSSSLHRPDDHVFRIGGEEFVVFFTSESESDAEKFAQTLIEAVQSSHLEHIKNEPYGVVTVSGGLCICDTSIDEINENEVYSSADKLLYKAKEAGRNCLKTTTR